MLIAFVRIDKDKEPDFKKGYEYIDELMKKPVLEWPQEFRFNEVDERYKSDVEAVEQTRQKLTEVLEMLSDAWGGHHREAADLVCENKVILITGGLSWGEMPTDLYRNIHRLVAAGVTPACGFDF